jgi:hypothetical protein
LLAIAFASSLAVTLFGLMSAMWGGSGLPAIPAFLFWFLPVLSLPVWASYFTLPKTAVSLSWLLLIANYAAYFLMIWRNAIAGNSTTTNPFVIALACLYGSPSILGLFVVAACLHLAARMEWLSKALDAPNP